MIRTLIVDDELPAREELIYMLEDFEDLEIIGEASHGKEAIELNKRLKPDLVFLDIEMPKLNGIEVAKQILTNDHSPYIMFVTAYEEYALDAFGVEAVDYILKPISQERLERGMERILAMDRAKNPKSQGASPYSNQGRGYAKPEMANKICVSDNGKLIPLNLREIIYATVEDKTTVIISSRGKYEVGYTLGELAEKLASPMFFRSHRSFLINLDHIEIIEPWFNSTFNVILKNIDSKIPVSRNQSKEFREIMNIN